MEPQRESAREGHVEEGVSVALLKLVTDGSRPRAAMSDSWECEKRSSYATTSLVCVDSSSPSGQKQCEQVHLPTYYISVTRVELQLVQFQELFFHFCQLLF